MAVKGMRAGWIGLWALMLLVAVYVLGPQHVPVILLKLAEIVLACFVGYWVDRHLFPYARPHEALQTGLWGDAGRWMIRRAIVVAACIIGVACGL